MRKLVSLLAIVALLVGCSDPRSTPLPSDLSKLETIKPQVEKLSAEDRELFAKYLMRSAMKGTMFSGIAGTTDATTIGQAIDNQKTFVAEATKRAAEEEALKAKAKAEREAAMKVLREIVTVALVSKRVDVERGYSGIEMDRHLNITVAYKNNGAKDIAGVKGALIVRDLFGDDLSTFRISNDDTIKAGSSIIWTGGRSLRFSMGSNKDSKFAELADDKYKVEWEPEAIVFTDGTRLPASK